MLFVVTYLASLSATFAPHSQYEPHTAYLNACITYLSTGDLEVIAAYTSMDDLETSIIACDSMQTEIDDEIAFRNWYAQTAADLRINRNPDNVRHHYDYRAFFHAMQKGEYKTPHRGQYFPRKFELPGHPNT